MPCSERKPAGHQLEAASGQGSESQILRRQASTAAGAPAPRAVRPAVQAPRLPRRGGEMHRPRLAQQPTRDSASDRSATTAARAQRKLGARREPATRARRPDWPRVSSTTRKLPAACSQLRLTLGQRPRLRAIESLARRAPFAMRAAHRPAVRIRSRRGLADSSTAKLADVGFHRRSQFSVRGRANRHRHGMRLSRRMRATGLSGIHVLRSSAPSAPRRFEPQLHQPPIEPRPGQPQQLGRLALVPLRRAHRPGDQFLLDAGQKLLEHDRLRPSARMRWPPRLPSGSSRGKSRGATSRPLRPARASRAPRPANSSRLPGQGYAAS